jgi:hypothetical protein
MGTLRDVELVRLVSREERKDRRFEQISVDTRFSLFDPPMPSAFSAAGLE